MYTTTVFQIFLADSVLMIHAIQLGIPTLDYKIGGYVVLF